MKTSAWFMLALGALFVFGELVLGISLFRIQVLNVADSRESQEQQTIRRVRVPGLRGRILDCKDRILAECRPSYCILCNLEEFQRRGAASNTVAAVDTAVDQVATALHLPRQISTTQIARHLRTASAIPLVAWRDIDAHVFAQFCERMQEFPGFSDHVEAERFYPYGNLAAHILGYTGRGETAGAENDPVYFSEKDMTGRGGVESFYNRYLAGVTGERHIRVDARGFRPTKARQTLLADTSESGVDPADGLDLRLTLDIKIQADVERELHSVTGACVVLNPRSGAVLAMASSPTFDPNKCVPTLSSAVYASLTNAPAKRGQNRAISEGYAPGSTFKPITALAGLATGWMPEDEYDCSGIYRLGNLRLHCWNRYGHSYVNVRQALKESCNTFFCNMGTAIGSNAVIQAARAFGLGARTGIDLEGEYAGVVPDDEWKRQWYNEPWYPGDTCQMCIGQGMLLVTPLQMAVVAATLGNGGDIYRPYLYARDFLSKPKPVRHIPFPDESLALVREGMKDVVDAGTGRGIAIRTDTAVTPNGRHRRYRLNVECGGKTGTAEIGRGETKRKNTWIIAFAPFDNPTIAIAMIVERGESGGKTVAPRVHNVLAGIFGENEISAIRATTSNLEGRD